VPLRVVDLFAGCGGLSAGFLSAGGFQVVRAVEVDRDAGATYAANFGDHVHVGDIRELRVADLESADVVVGGPPCQGFSSLGRQDPNDPRSALWREYSRILRAVDPEFFVLENVPQFLQSQQYADLLAATAPGGELSAWRLEPHLLNAAHYGVAQARRRAIVVGRRRSRPALGLPEPATARSVLRDVLGDVPPTVTAVDLPDSWTEFRDEPVRGIFKMQDLHVTRRPNERSLQRYRAVPPGGNRFDLPWELQTPGWRRHTSGSGDVMGRLRWDKPSVTIRTEFFKPEKGRYLHPEEDRPLTHLEAALIQGFPPDFLWCGNKSSIARQIGNAVPVPLARAVAEHVRDHARG
jgi:DNA (cytosine-5)-methyltransferase 1